MKHFIVLSVLILFLVKGSINNENSCLKDEYDVLWIMKSLIENLEIRQGILVGELDKTIYICFLKILSSYQIPNTYQSFKGLSYYLKNGLFPPVKTALILKENNLLNLVKIFKEIEEVNLLHRVSQFTWLIFSNRSFEPEEYEKLPVPYNCEFFSIYPTSQTIYKILEIYKVKNKTFYYNFGLWDNNLNITNLSFIKRRINLQGTPLILDYVLERNLCVGLACSQLEMVYSLEYTMNFSFVERKVNSTSFIGCQPLYNDTDFFAIGLPFAAEFYNFECDIYGPILETGVNWYIKEPIVFANADYYLQPFNFNLWAAILVSVIAGGLFSFLISFLRKIGIKKMVESKKFYYIDSIFMPLESFCCQDGGSMSLFKVIVFSFRFLALFVLAVYFGIILSFLTVKISVIPFETPEEFIENDEYFLCFYSPYGNANPPAFLTVSNNTVMLKLLKKSKIIEQAKVLDHVCNENFAVAAVGFDIYTAEQKCQLHEIKHPILSTGSASSLQRHSPFTKMFNYARFRFTTSGILNRMITSAAADMPTYNNENDFHPVEFSQMIQVLSITLIGVGLSLIIFSGEYFFDFLKSKHSRKSKSKTKRNRLDVSIIIDKHLSKQRTKTIIFVDNFSAFYN